MNETAIPAKLKATRIHGAINDPGIAPGSYKFYGAGFIRVGGFNFTCPCGCGIVGSVRFKADDQAGWRWDSNMDAPTVDPSIIISTVVVGEEQPAEHWHGWLRGGFWERA